FGFEGAQADLYGELRAVLASPVEFQTRAHGACLRARKVPAAMTGMSLTEALGYQDLDGLPQEVGPTVVEEFLRLRVDEDNAALPVDNDHGVWRGLQEISELRFGPLAVADVVHEGGEPVDVTV